MVRSLLFLANFSACAASNTAHNPRAHRCACPDRVIVRTTSALPEHAPRARAAPDAQRRPWEHAQKGAGVQAPRHTHMLAGGAGNGGAPPPPKKQPNGVAPHLSLIHI
eukprot:6426620-Prymnesium_polylepis.2